MTIYIVERITPECFEEPQVFLNGDSALISIRKEYINQMDSLGVNLGDDEDDCGYKRNYDIDENNFRGTCSIEETDGDDRWQWRITVHEIM